MDNAAQVRCGKGVRSVCSLEDALREEFNDNVEVSGGEEGVSVMRGVYHATEAIGLQELALEMRDSIYSSPPHYI